MVFLQKFFSSGKKVLAIVGLILIAYLLLDLNHRVEELIRLSSEREVMATQVAVVKQTEVMLQTQIAYANSDAAVEKWAREEAFLARPGDHPIIMLPDPSYQPTIEPTPVVTVEPVDNWQVWALLFFGD